MCEVTKGSTGARLTGGRQVGEQLAAHANNSHRAAVSSTSRSCLRVAPPALPSPELLQSVLMRFVCFHSSRDCWYKFIVAWLNSWL